MKKTLYTVILFYKFTPIENPEQFRDEQRALADSLHLLGRLLIAPEGINGTFEGTTENIEIYKQKLQSLSEFKDLVFKDSASSGKSFSKLEVKVRAEAVTLGVGALNVTEDTAPKLSAAQLEEWYEKGEDFVVLDLRNQFEIEVGRFENTISPQLVNFRDLPAKISELEHLKSKRIVTVCTGGIRCEKATPYLKKQGFKNLYQLEDGIHTYLQKYPQGKFKGTLFVFDNRMTTPVIESGEREIIGRCTYCQIPCEDFYNDDSVRPSRKVICCPSCIHAHTKELRSVNI